MFSRIFAIVFVTFALTGCIYSRFQTPGTIDSSQKTITVPAGNYGIKGDVKKYLASSGWLIITAQDGEDTASSTAPAKTRYRLVVETETHHDCMNFEPLVLYDVAMIDNQTNTEVLTLSGKGCGGSVTNKFKQAVEKAMGQ